MGGVFDECPELAELVEHMRLSESQRLKSRAESIILEVGEYGRRRARKDMELALAVERLAHEVDKLCRTVV